jgi:hypothetical protein
MFFFFGMNTSDKEYGTEGYHVCTRCNKTGYWKLVKRTTWLILMFIPIPVRVRYLAVCPGCGGSAEMTKEEFNEAVRRNGSGGNV